MCIEYLDKSLKAFLKNYKVLLTGSLTIMLFTAAFFSLSIALVFRNPIPFLTSSFVDVSYFATNSTPMVIAGIIVFILSAITLVVLQGGFYSMAMEGLSKKSELKTMVKTVREKWKIIVGAFAVLGLIYLFIFTLSFLILSYLFFNPIATAIVALSIFAVSIFFSFIYPAVVKGSGSIESLKASFGVARKKYVEAMLLVLFFSLASFLLRSIIEIVPMGNLLGYLVIYILIFPWEAVAFSLFFQKISQKPR